ncbi:unnamed protein product [Miscanthus lutarioriparius]|uniref:Uncharacterized protein n=1 Tax=Miscanthus lutarioriparius TaxID=422564 RepID=A0A811RPS1_9POAL|nr:unnamed protein product [Miscanthus lutarioriparius]
MQRLASSRRLLQAALAPARANSSLSAAAAAAAAVPKMPAFGYTPPPYDGPRADEIFRKRAQFLSPSLFHFYDRPLNIVDGKMQYLFDEDGRRYLDAFGGIATVCCGHCHPDVVEAIVNQAKRIQHSTVLYLNHAIADFAEALVSKMPGDLKVVFFTNSGTEANELALMIARLYTGCNDIISLRNGYHGNAAGTMGATAQSNWKFNVVQLIMYPDGVHHALNPDPYRGAFGSDGEKYARDVQEIIEFGTTGRVGGFISEAIQGIGNGIPIGAVVTTPEIAQVLTRRSYFNTFGGNPVSTAGGHAVLKVLEKEKLQENAFVVGSYLKEQLNKLKEKHEIIGDVRGKGFLLGVELVTDREKKTPAKVEISHVMNHMKDMGVLVGKGGFYGNVFRITPPLCFTKDDSDFFIEVMDIALSKL